MAKQDVVVQLSVEGKQYETAIENAKRKLTDLKKSGDGATSGISDGFSKIMSVGAKLAPAIAGITGALAGFKEMANHSQTMTDLLGKTMQSTTALVDGFFYSISVGNFDNFINGLSDIVALAKEAYTALDQFNVAKILNEPAIESAEATMKKYKSTMENTALSIEERLQAKEQALKAGEGLEAIYKDSEAKALGAYTAQLNALIGAKTGGKLDAKLSNEILSSSITYDSNKKWIEEYEAYTEKRKEEIFEEAYNSFRKEGRTQGASRGLAGKKRTDFESFRENNSEYQIRKALTEITNEELTALKSFTTELNKFKRDYTGILDDINSIQDYEVKGDAVKITAQDKKLVSTSARAIFNDYTPEIPAELKPTITDSSKKEISGIIATLQQELDSINIDIKFTESEEDIQQFISRRQEIENQLALLQTPLEEIQQQISDISLSMVQEFSGVINSFSQFGNVINSDASALDKFSAGINLFIGMLQSMKTVTELSTASTSLNAVATQANTSAKASEAVAGATASGAKMPFPFNLIAIATGVAAVIGALASMGKFANGGIVGGNSIGGDSLLVRVNSGEMVLNTQQQRNLFSLLNSAGVGGGSTFGDVEFKISGRDLVGTVNTYNRYNNKLK